MEFKDIATKANAQAMARFFWCFMVNGAYRADLRERNTAGNPEGLILFRAVVSMTTCPLA